MEKRRKKKKGEKKKKKKNRSCKAEWLTFMLSFLFDHRFPNLLPFKPSVSPGISSSVLSVFFTDNCYKLLKSLHLIGWEQICQWKTLKTLDEMPPCPTVRVPSQTPCTVPWATHAQCSQKFQRRRPPFQQSQFQTSSGGPPPHFSLCRGTTYQNVGWVYPPPPPPPMMLFLTCRASPFFHFIPVPILST